MGPMALPPGGGNGRVLLYLVRLVPLPLLISARQETRFFFAGLCPVDPAFDPRALPFVQTFFYTIFYHCLSHVSAMAGHTAPEICSLSTRLELVQAARASVGLDIDPRASMP